MRSNSEQKKAALKALAKMAKETAIAVAAIALEEAILKGVNNIDSIWATYLRMTSNLMEARDLILPDKVSELYHGLLNMELGVLDRI